MKKKVLGFFVLGLMKILYSSEEYNIEKIEISGSKILNDKKARKNIKEKLETLKDKKTKEEIYEEILEIKKELFDDGYILSNILIGDENIVTDGKLSLVLTDGKIEKIVSVSENKEKVIPSNVFPVDKGEAIKVDEMNEGLNNFNLLGSNRGVIGIKDGKEIGDSIITIQNQEDKSYGGYLGYTYTKNYNESKENNLSLSLYKENLFNLNEKIVLSYSDKPSEETQEFKFSNLKDTQYNRDFSLSILLPVKKWVYQLTGEYNVYKEEVEGLNDVYTRKGRTYTEELLAKRSIFQKKNLEMSYQIGIKRQDIKHFIDDIELETNSRILSRVTNSLQLKNDIMDVNLIYDKGVKILGATNDNDKPLNSPKAQYDLLKLESDFIIPVSKKTMLGVKVNGQYSFDSVYDESKFEAPFTSRTIKGDSGVYNELYVIRSLGDFKKMKVLANIKLENGYLWDKNSSTEEVFGYSAGLDLNIGKMRVGVSYGKIYSSNVEEYKNNDSVNANFGVSF